MFVNAIHKIKQPGITILRRSTLLLAILMSGDIMAQADNAAKDTVVKPLNALPNKEAQYPVLYKTQKDEHNVSSVGYVKGSYLESAPTNSPLTGLAGRMSGLYIRQNSGEPGADIPTLSLRGLTPLILIDGVPRSSTAFNPEQIESIVVLKDAQATAMLGMRGMNGAVLITTKKGNAAASKFNLNFKAQAGVQSPTRMRKYLNAYNYALLYNEALANDGKAPAYSANDLQAYRSGSDPYGHPDVDWVKTILKDNASFNRYTLNADGSSNAFNYFVSLDYMDQGGLLRESEMNTYSTNSTFKRYSFRSNLEMKLNAKTNLFLNLFGRIREGNEPGIGSENIYPDFNTTPNNAYPVFNPNKTLGGNINYQSNIYGKSVYTGYYNTLFRDAFADLGFVRELDDIVKGWWVKGVASFNTNLVQEINRSKQYQVFQMNKGAAGDTSYQRFGPDPLPQQSNSSGVSNRSQQFYVEVSTGISRKLGAHAIDAMLLANSDNTSLDANLSEKYKTLAANVQYALRDKYLLQAAASYNSNNRFLTGKQAGLFPSVGLGWNVHKEKFLQNASFISGLKLKASYGLTGNALPGYYEYIGDFTGSTGYVFGTGAGVVNGIAQSTLSNNRTWEKARKLNVGLDLSFAKDKGWFSFEYYQNKLSDLLQVRGNNTALLGMTYPLENLGKHNYSGIEMNLGWANNIGKFQYDVSANLTTVGTNVVFNDEPARPYSWMNRTNHPVGQLFGYKSNGFVTGAGQGMVVEGYQSVPGDLQYVDLNKDGVINQYDQTSIGHERPVLFYGLQGGLRYSSFYLHFVVQGVANRQILNTGNSFWEFQANGKGQAYPHHLERWNSATAPWATYPRLSVGTNVNNHVVSDFWLQNGDFIRLRNVEFGYDLKGGSLLRKAKLEKVRFFVNGINLLTITSFKQTDPEAPTANYPVQRVINGGISITL